MFGIGPVPQESELRTTSTSVYQASIVGALLFGLGLACMILATALGPRLIASDSSVLVIGLPLVAASVLGLVLGYANLHTRIEIGGGRLEVVAPSWRGFPAPPLQHLSVALDEVRTVRRRTERLGFGLPGLYLPVDVHAIETTRGRVVLAGYYQGDLEIALTELIARAGCQRADDGRITVGLGRMLCKGAVPFGGDADVSHSRPVRIDPPR